MKSQILKMGHPLLHCKSLPVEEFNTNELDATINMLLDAQKAHQGAGLAAPQLGINARILCVGGETTRYSQSRGTECLVMINPELAIESDELVSGWEGCLSVPGLRGLVLRYQTVSYRAKDVLGNDIAGEVSGFMARALQHECDHLDGVLFPERVKNFKCFGFEEALTEEVI